MRLSMRLMAERGGRSELLGRYLDDPLYLFIPVRILIGLVTVMAAVLIARSSDIQSAPFGDGLHRLVRGVCDRVRAPGSDGARPAGPEEVLDVLLPLFTPLASLLMPITVALVEVVWRREREREAPNNGTPDTEADPAPETAADENDISEEEGRELLQSIVDFTETVVKEVMTPRPDVVAVPVESTLQDLRSVFREEQYSRMPVYRESLDNIVGVAFVKDLVALPPGAEPPLTTLMRAATFVPESKRVSDLLKEMQRRQVQLAIVVDEYGGTAGLVTVEDLLEEIVGEIRDEYDVESETVTDEGNGVFVISGKVSVDEVRDRLGVAIEREGFETLGGYLLSYLGRMPYVGEAFEIDELSVEVLEVERRRITRVRVRRTSPEAS